jgi:hypothetical protein
MTAEELIAQFEALIAEYRTPPPPEFPTVLPGEPLPDGTFKLSPDLTYPALTLRTGHRVIGQGARVNGSSSPAVYIPPTVTDVYVEDIICSSVYQSVIVLGDNILSTQGSLDKVPARITLNRIKIPTHRGKRGIEVNATDVVITDPEILDVYSTALSDSQAIGILNTPGNITIRGGRLNSGSEVVMIGGDTMKLPNTIQTNILIEGVELFRPLSWQTDGVNRAVKNLFEVKSGVDIVMRNCVLDGSWEASQTGWAFVITPKNSQYIKNVLIDGCTIRNVGGLVQLLGKDYNTVTPQATSGVVFKNCNFTVNSALFGGYGIVSTLTGGMRDVVFDGCVGTFNGSQIVLSDTNATYGQQGPITIVNCTMPTGAYGLKADGTNYGDPLSPTSVYVGQELLVNQITGNTFSGAPSRFKTNFPNNTFV